MKHYAIHGEDVPVKGKWVQQLLKGQPVSEMQEMRGKKGALFSDVVLEKFLEEDHRHGYSALNKSYDRSILTSSSGEKRKALLRHLLDQLPDFLILSDPFDCLDRESVLILKKELQEVSNRIAIVQLLNRKEDLLEFVTDVLLIKEEKWITVDEFRTIQIENKEKDEPEIKIPPAPEEFADIPEILIQMNDVSVNYGERPVFKDINWTIKKGEFWQLSGPNGSGKTTLLNMIYGDNPKAYGVNLILFGKRKGSGESVWDIKRKIGYFSPSITELFKRTHSVEQMLISGLVDSVGLYQRPSDKQVFLARQWLSALNLLGERNRHFREMSLLKQRMVLIARAMIKHPPLLILDEPSTSLDEHSALILKKLINNFAEKSETSILYVSHRREKGLKPQFTYELVPTEDGSVGRVI